MSPYLFYFALILFFLNRHFKENVLCDDLNRYLYHNYISRHNFSSNLHVRCQLDTSIWMSEIYYVPTETLDSLLHTWSPLMIPICYITMHLVV